MKVNRKQVTKISITEIKDLDPISVILEDFGVGQGKATIECFGKAWSNYWGAMGNSNISDFLIDSHYDYLIEKFQPTLNRQIPIDDEEEMKVDLKKKIIEYRMDLTFEKEQARTIWNDVESTPNLVGNERILWMVHGDDWWEYIPTRTNPDYEYFKRIIEALQEGLKI